MKGIVRIVNKKHFAIVLGCNLEESMTGIQIHTSKHEVSLRIDILFFGLFIGWED